MLVPLNKEKAAMLVPRPNPPVDHVSENQQYIGFFLFCLLLCKKENNVRKLFSRFMSTAGLSSVKL